MNIVAPPAANWTDAEEGVRRKAAIARSFETAAPAYDRHASVQRRVATELAGHVAKLDLPEAPQVLEIGCGTGFLGKALLRNVPDARLLCTDLSPAMAWRCREKVGRRGQFAIMDGELPAVAPVFDLVVSSFAFQWFLDLGGGLSALAACLKPGGRLAFASLGADSLAEWRALQRRAGVSMAGLAFPEGSEVRAMAARTGRLRGTVTDEKIEMRYASVTSFLHELKSLGAGATGLSAPASVADMRRLLRLSAADRSAFPVTYHVLYGLFEATGPAR